MLTKKWTLFAQLYRRDMEKVGKESLGLAGVALVIILLSLAPWSKNIVIVPVFIVAGVAMFLPLLTSMLSLHREWRENSIYMLLSLPVGGTAVLGTKLLAALTQLIINTIIVLAMGIISGLQFLPREEIDWTLLWGQFQAGWQQMHAGEILPFLVVLGVLSVVYIICSLQLGLLIGKLFRRFTALATIGGIVAVFWLSTSLYSGVLKILFNQVNWKPGMGVPNLELTVSAVLMAGVIALIFAGSVYVYNHRVEV